MDKLDEEKTVVVLSGGQDSTTCLFWAKTVFKEVHAITFDYGQRHSREIDAARTVAEMANVTSHEILSIGDTILKSVSPLVSDDHALEQYDSYEQMEKMIGDRVELTFVPMRNALFLMIAANRAVALGCNSIITGVCQMDNANYPDCRLEFIKSTERTIEQALGLDSYSFSILTPLISKTKAESIHWATKVPGAYEALAFTHTAYDGAYPPVGHDHATMLRAEGFIEAGMPDPLIVRAFNEGLMDLPASENYDDLRKG